MANDKQARIASKFSEVIVKAIDQFLIDHIPNAHVSTSVLKALTGAAPTLAERLPSPADPQALEYFNVLQGVLIDMLPSVELRYDGCLWASGD